MIQHLKVRVDQCAKKQTIRSLPLLVQLEQENFKEYVAEGHISRCCSHDGHLYSPSLGSVWKNNRMVVIDFRVLYTVTVDDGTISSKAL